MSKPRMPRARYGKSQKLFEQACGVMPGGVSSPVRSFRSVGTTPVYIKDASGCQIIDVDGNHYIDYVMSYGPLIAGHAPQAVRAAVAKQMDRGSSYGCCSEGEVQMATLISDAMPNVPMLRLVNSGTEAVMSALRLARGATGRSLIVKCSGCYHGHVDALLVEAGSGATTHGNPSSPGIPAAITQNTLLVGYNDLEGAKALFALHGPQIAAMILEPICGNMGVVLPRAGYLEGLRELCDQAGALLIFDEVMTGFRVSYGGAQSLLGIRPDLTCLGKIIGGGLPVGAYGGRAELMNQISPAGPIYQAGTLSGNPLAMAAGLATLKLLEDNHVYTHLKALGLRLEEGLREAAAEFGIPLTIQRCGSMITPFFLSADQDPGAGIQTYADALRCDTDAYARFFRSMLDGGVMLPPSQFEAWFLSMAHGEQDIDMTLEQAREAFRSLKQ